MPEAAAGGAGGRGGLDRRRRRARRAARPAGRRPRHGLPRARGRGPALRAALAGARRFRSPSATEPGASRSRTGGPSTSRRSRTGSRTTSPRATSRSTRWRGRSAGGEPLDPFGGQGDIDRETLRAVAPGVFGRSAPPAARGPARGRARLPAATRRPRSSSGRRGARSKPAGERILGELDPPRPAGFERLGELGLLAPLGGSLERLRSLGDTTSDIRLVAVFGDRLGELPISNELRRYARTLLRAELPADDSPRAIHRFRRATEPWANDALGSPAGMRSSCVRSTRRARAIPPSRCFAATSSACRRAGDRRVARPDRRRARRWHDLDARGGAGAHPPQRVALLTPST